MAGEAKLLRQQAACGHAHTLLVTDSGEMWCFGGNKCVRSACIYMITPYAAPCARERALNLPLGLALGRWVACCHRCLSGSASSGPRSPRTRWTPSASTMAPTTTENAPLRCVSGWGAREKMPPSPSTPRDAARVSHCAPSGKARHPGCGGQLPQRGCHRERRPVHVGPGGQGSRNARPPRRPWPPLTGRHASRAALGTRTHGVSRARRARPPCGPGPSPFPVTATPSTGCVGSREAGHVARPASPLTLPGCGPHRNPNLPCLIRAFTDKAFFPETVHIKYAACGADHTVAVDDQGGVYTWGLGNFGNLGHGDTKDQVRPPVSLSLLCTLTRALCSSRRGMWRACGSTWWPRCRRAPSTRRR